MSASGMKSGTVRILVVEDDPLLAESLARALGQQSNVIDSVATAGDAEAALRSNKFALILLDIGLPDADGFELLRQWRLRGEATPVLVITARDTVNERIYGLDLGADDYLVKPFSVSELEARVRALLRRANSRGPTPLSIRGLSVDPLARRIRVNGEPVELTVREWALLELFLAHPGRVLSKAEIAQSLETIDNTVAANAAVVSNTSVAPNTIEVYVSRLRAKIEPAGVSIRTVRGFGYLWE